MDESFLKEIYILNEILTPLVSSYRLSVGAAEEFNRIALAHRKDVEDAIDRADDLGHLIDKVQKKLGKYMKSYFAELDYKLEYMEEIREKTAMREKFEDKLNMIGKNKKGNT
jgi:predicted translin family RNA/ssDNA-binding protein